MALQKLLSVQKVDLRIQGLETEASAIPRQLKEWDNSLGSQKDEMARLKQEADEKKKEQRQLERLLEQKQAALVKFNSQLPQIKTNREYKAILLEVDSVEKEMSDVEEKILLKMDEVERAEARMHEKLGELQKAQQEIEAKKKQLQQRKQALEESLHGTRSERQNLVSTVEASLLHQYDRIRVHKGGLAVAQILEESCGACHMELPPQTVNEVIGGKILPCPNCSRLLYWDEQKQ